MISCIFYFDFAVCMQKLYNHSAAYKNSPVFVHKMFSYFRIRGYFTYFDKKFAKRRLWKNLWKV
jgi:hypothetical protein